MECEDGILRSKRVGMIWNGWKCGFVAMERDEWKSQEKVCVVAIDLCTILAVNKILNHKWVETVAHAESLDRERLCMGEMRPIHSRPNGVWVHEERFDSLQIGRIEMEYDEGTLNLDACTVVAKMTERSGFIVAGNETEGSKYPRSCSITLGLNRDSIFRRCNIYT